MAGLTVLVACFFLLIGARQVWLVSIVLVVMLSTWLALLGWWLRMCCEKVLILLDTKRIVIKRDAFGWSRIEEMILNADSRAELMESYIDNDSYVEMQGSDGCAEFGVRLSLDELNWLVDTINQFLGVDPEPTQTRRAALRVSLLETPIPQCVTVEVQTPDSLRLRLPMAATGSAKAGGVVLEITLGFIPIAMGLEFNWWWPYYVLPAFLCLLMAMLLVRGTTIIELTHLQLRQISLLGPCRFTQCVATADIVQFDTVLNEELAKRARTENLDMRDNNCVAVLSSPEKQFVLWMAKEHDTKYVAKLLNQKLNQIRNGE
jgi:hypothetical protein